MEFSDVPSHMVQTVGDNRRSLSQRTKSVAT
jgi:hypothetical protein